jgi:hypothetical protein
MTNKISGKAKSTRIFAVNKLRVRIPWLIEVEGEGVIPVLGALILCLLLIGWMVLR